MGTYLHEVVPVDPDSELARQIMRELGPKLDAIEAAIEARERREAIASRLATESAERAA